MEKEIIEIIADVAEIPVKKIKKESNLIRDLELESLDLVTLVSVFEERFQIYVLDKDIKDLQTVEDIINYIASHV